MRVKEEVEGAQSRKGEVLFGRSFVKELMYFSNTEVGAFN